MTRKKPIIIALLAFVAGCMGGPAIEALVVRPLSAQQAAAGVQRWEYQCVDLSTRRHVGPQDWTGPLNEMGAQGWEMSALVANSTWACFKRPL